MEHHRLLCRVGDPQVRTIPSELMTVVMTELSGKLELGLLEEQR